jgi:antitoxin HicB
MTKKRSKHRGSRLDEFLKEEGLFDELQATAIKEVIAWQIAQAMKEQRVSKIKMAELMKTSRAQLDRLLDPTSGNVTLDTLQRAAAILGRQLHVELA